MGDTHAALARVAELEAALADLIDAAENRVPGDEAWWSERVDEARSVLRQKGES